MSLMCLLCMLFGPVGQEIFVLREARSEALSAEVIDYTEFVAACLDHKA